MSQLTRRELLRWGLLGTGAVALAACAPPQPAPAPEQPAAPAKEEPKKEEEVITLRFMTRQGSAGDHHREFAKRFADESGGKIKVEAEDTAWGEIPRKLETQLVTGTMVDLAVMSTRNFPYLAKRGAFLVIEELVKEADVDLDRWFIINWFRRWTDGKLSGLGGAAGLSNLIAFYNREWVLEAWGKEPTDEWTMEDYVECMQACVKLKGKGHFGGTISIGGSVEADSWICNWGSSYMDEETYTKCQFSEPKVQDGIKWIMEQLANGNYPGREDSAEGVSQMFFGGKLAIQINNPGASTGMVKGCEEAGIDLGVVLYPRGESTKETPPRYGFCPYANNFAISAQTKYPREAFGLMMRVLSVESFKWLNAKTGKQPGALLDTWYDPEIVARYPWFPKCADVMKQCPDYYPVPANTRYIEWQDVGNNEIQPLVYGEIEYNQANIDTITEHLQEVLDQPLPGE